MPIANPRAVRAAPASVAPVPPLAIAIAVPFHTPVVIVPTEVRLDAVTPEPRVDPERTEVPAIRNDLPVKRFKFSDEVQASVASIQLKVLSVAPLSVRPPPSAPASVGEAVEPSSRFLSSTVTVVELMVVVVPLTVKSPERVRDVPVAAPMFGVTSVGVLANTSAPVPVSSDIIPASSDEEVAAKSESLLLVRATVPVASGSVIVLSAVGSVTARVVS